MQPECCDNGLALTGHIFRSSNELCNGSLAAHCNQNEDITVVDVTWHTKGLECPNANNGQNERNGLIQELADNVRFGMECSAKI